MAQTETLAHLVRQIRRLTQDSVAGAYRRDDTAMTDAINSALRMIRRYRPDATVAITGTLAVSEADLPAGLFPLDDAMFEPALWFAIGYLEAADDELVESSKAIMSMGVAQNLLMGGG